MSPIATWCSWVTRTILPIRANWVGTYWGLVLLISLFPIGLLSLQSSLALASNRIVLHHNLTMRMVPDTHEIQAHDTIVVDAQELRPFTHPLRLTLNGNLTVEQILIDTHSTDFTIIDPSKDSSDRQNPIQVIEIPVGDRVPVGTPLQLSIHYKGVIDDPPRKSKGLRFVRPDKTFGHIGPEGIYLTSETVWYPDFPETLSTFSIQVTLPSDWMAVTQGHQTFQQSEGGTTTATWKVETPSEALTLVANHFVKHQRNWKGIEMATYLFPEDAHLSEQYLDATAKYLEVYTKLLGPYPFEKFAVVENFFPSGIGLPSYTLLGSRVIKRGYTQPYSLGHEIVHSWLGNSVLNDFSTGNWVEGLTTYLANYYYEERYGSSDSAFKNRRRMVHEFNLYAPASKEYPLVQFHHKENRIDNAIGYQKSAMVFHMLRRELEDEAFFSGIRTLIRDQTGAYADWKTLEHVFEQAAGRELGWFFSQWVHQPGAPELRIRSTDGHPQEGSSEGYLIEITVDQTPPHYEITLPLRINLANGQIYESFIRVKANTTTETIPVPTQPIHLAVDPQFDTLRRLQPEHIPPMLNVWVTAQDPVVILPGRGFEQESSVYQPILHRLQSGEHPVTILPTEEGIITHSNSQLVLDDPQSNHLSAKVLEHCPAEDFKLATNQLTIRGQTFEGPSIAWLISCPHPTRPGHTITVFSGFSPSALSRVARLLFFYGWDSYLVFKDGTVVTRGTLELPNTSLEVSLKAT